MAGYYEEALPQAEEMAENDKKLDTLKQRVAAVEAEVRAASSSLVEIRSDLKWHARIGWTIASLLASAFLGTLGWLVMYDIPHEIDARIPANFAQDFPKMQQKIDDIDARLNHLTPASLNELIPSIGSNLHPAEVADRLGKAAKLMNTAMTLKIPGSPELLVPLNQRLSEIRREYSGNPVLRPAIDRAAVDMSAYELESRFLLSGGVPGSSVASNSVTNKPVVIIADVGATVHCALQSSEPEVFRFGSSAAAENFVIINLTVRGCSQVLDGPRWIGVEFKSSHLAYNGGALYLSNVRFVDCSFKFQDDAKSRRAEQIIENSHGEPVSLFLPRVF